MSQRHPHPWPLDGYLSCFLSVSSVLIDYFVICCKTKVYGSNLGMITDMKIGNLDDNLSNLLEIS